MNMISRVIVGVHVFEADFWNTRGYLVRCPRCEAERAGQYCQECGAQLVQVPVRDPKPPLLALGRASEDPEATWNRLLKGSAQVRLFVVDAVASPGILEPDKLAFGTQILGTEPYSYDLRQVPRAPLRATSSQIAEAILLVTAESRKINLHGVAELFLTVRVQL